MKLIFPHLPSGVTTDPAVSIDFTDAETRQFIECLHLHLTNYNKYGGLNPDVKVDARTDQFLARFRKQP